MFLHLKHKLIKKIEKIPLLQIFIYNNLKFFKFLLPHHKDYYASKLLFSKNEKRSFLDVGGNIGLSSLGFISLGFKKNKIHIFEPDKELVKNHLNPIKKKYKNLNVYSFGLAKKNSIKKLYRAYYKKIFFHFNNSFSKKYIKDKLFDNYGDRSKKFVIKSKSLYLKKFDELKIKEEICFIKIDVEGLDHEVIFGMKKCIKNFLPTILVEYNYSNFSKIHSHLKSKYNCYFYDFVNNKLIKLSIHSIKKLKKGIILEKVFMKNSVNIFFIKR